ncbi:MAG: hypothetical protein C4576_23210 [Desulfobacteraceae bacterium]|nr:MAG: hypothetical protein C4576_23210 [Desulfobacteraceae bacterium]
MKSKLVICLFLMLILASGSFAEQRSVKDLNTPEPPIDVALSPGGKWIYVLTEEGNVLVYGPEGRLREKIPVGKNLDRLVAGPLEDLLILTSRKDNLVRILQVDLHLEFDTSGSPSKGPAEAPVELVVFSDFQCGYCLQLRAVLEEIHNVFPRDVKIIFKNFPLKSHPFAVKAALSALSAARQGRFWEFHDLLFKSFNNLNDDRISEIARELKLDLDLFEKMKKDSSVQEQLRKDLREGEKAGLRGVPVLFINGKIQRDRTMEGISREITNLLLKEKRTIERNGPLSTKKVEEPRRQQ